MPSGHRSLLLLGTNSTAKTDQHMPTSLTQILEAMQQHAKTCETASKDATEESLTGEASLREKNEQAASEWMLKSKVWLEAEAVVRGIVEPPKLIE